MNRKLSLFVLFLLFFGVLACGPLGSTADPTPEGDGKPPTPTLAPTATPDVQATLIAAQPTPVTPEPTTAAAADGADSTTSNGQTPTDSGGSDGAGGGGGGDSGGGDSGGGDSGGGSNNGGGDGGATAGGAAAGCPAGGQNLLLNPSFEGEYKPFGAIRELNHAPNWFPFWVDGQSNFRPEFKPAESSTAANRVHSGSRAQQYFKSWGMYRAGMYQSVLNIPKGARVQASAYGQAWSCEDFSMCPDGSSVNPANMFMRVGIDPWGDTDPFSGDIVWSDYFNPLDQWQVACVTAVSEAEIVTVYLWASPDAPRMNQDVYWDDASLVILP